MQSLLCLVALVAVATAKTVVWSGPNFDLKRPEVWSAGYSPFSQAATQGVKMVFPEDAPGYMQMKQGTYQFGKRWVAKRMRLTFDVKPGETVKIVLGGTGEDEMNELKTAVADAVDLGCAANYKSNNRVLTAGIGTTITDPDAIVQSTLIAYNDVVDFQNQVVRSMLSKNVGFNVAKFINVAGTPAGTEIDSCAKVDMYPHIRSQFLDLCDPSNYPDPDPVAAALPSHKGRIWLGGTDANCIATGDTDENNNCYPSSTCLLPEQATALAQRQERANEIKNGIKKDAANTVVTWTIAGDWVASQKAEVRTAECTQKVRDKLISSFVFDAEVDAASYDLTANGVDIALTTLAGNLFPAGVPVNTNAQTLKPTDDLASHIAALISGVYNQCIADAAEAAANDKKDAADDAEEQCGAACDSTDFSDAKDTISQTDSDTIEDLLDAITCTTECTVDQGTVDQIINDKCGDDQACKDALTQVVTTASSSPEAKDAITAQKDAKAAQEDKEDIQASLPKPRWIVTPRYLNIGTTVISPKRLSLAGSNAELYATNLRKEFLKTFVLDMDDIMIRTAPSTNRRRRTVDPDTPVEVSFNASLNCLDSESDEECLNSDRQPTNLNGWENAANELANTMDYPLPTCRVDWTSTTLLESCVEDQAKKKCSGSTSQVKACTEKLVDDLTKCNSAGINPATNECFVEQTVDEEVKKTLNNKAFAAASSNNNQSDKSASSGGGMSIIPIAAAAGGVVILVAIVIVAVKKGWIGKGKSSSAAKADRNVVAFENPMYDDPTTGDSAPTYDAATGGDSEGLYDEPAFNQAANKDNPLYESTEDLTGGGDEGGYLDTDANDAGGYLDTEPAAEEGGYLDVAPDE